MVKQLPFTLGLLASLHPHFSDTGDRLFWTVRKSTGKKIRQRLFHQTPGKENPWDGWHLVIANFKRDFSGKAKLTNRIDLYRGEGGIFESHALRSDVIWFSHTKSGRPLVDDIYRARWDGTQRVNITKSPGTWEEHGEPSPGGSLVTFNSSRSFDWKNPPDTAKTLRLEPLWARDRRLFCHVRPGLDNPKNRHSPLQSGLLTPILFLIFA